SDAGGAPAEMPNSAAAIAAASVAGMTVSDNPRRSRVIGAPAHKLAQGAAMLRALPGDPVADDTVDVLIIGAGAAGAGIAWSRAETRMRIVCLEQGDWMNPLDYPSTRMGWELERFAGFGFSPNGRGRREDYPINDGDSPIKISNFNAVGGST